MKMTKNQYSDEFKEQILKECQEIGNVALVARRHEISPNTIHTWISKQRQRGSVKPLPKAKDTRYKAKENDKSLTDIDNRLEELQTQLLKLASSQADYEDVADEIYSLREQKQKALVENAGRDELRKRISDMSAFLQEQPTAITEYDESLVRRLIEKVTVCENKFTMEFKSGVMVDVEA
jgi:transposase-like protein